MIEIPDLSDEEENQQYVQHCPRKDQPGLDAIPFYPCSHDTFYEGFEVYPDGEFDATTFGREAAKLSEEEILL